MSNDFKRLPSVEKSISEIKDRDIRVSVVGTVIDSQDQAIIIDDGTGKVKAVFESLPASIPKLVRVIGRVMPFENGVEISGEVLQNMEKLDLNVFKKLTSINKA